jgi:hypothetical protein
MATNMPHPATKINLRSCWLSGISIFSHLSSSASEYTIVEYLVKPLTLTESGQAI